MKKILLIFLIFCSLCGCQKESPEYLISSIGFDNKNGDLTVCLEAVIINSENTEQSLKVLKSTARDVELALKEIKRQATQPILLSHCGVIVIGESVTEKQLKEIYNFCFSEKEITLSALVVKTASAQKLLSLKPVSSASVGYDIMGILRENPKVKNRFFEVYSAKKNIMLPKIIIENEGFLLENY